MPPKQTSNILRNGDKLTKCLLQFEFWHIYTYSKIFLQNLFCKIYLLILRLNITTMNARKIWRGSAASVQKQLNEEENIIN